MDFRTRYQYTPATDLIGKGGFAKVYKAADTLLNRTVALKFFNNNGDKRHTLIKEISKAISLEHPNLCRYYDANVLENTDMHGDTETIEVGIMEYLDGGTLNDYLLQHPKDRDKLLVDVLQGLAFLHQQGIIHRDLKPQNILVKTTAVGPVAKITDFGISKAISDASSSSELVGTMLYMAPEQFNPQRYGIGGKIGTNVDLWSFGVMAYELISGESLFGDDTNTSRGELMERILRPVDDQKLNKLPQKHRAVLQRCLRMNANERERDANALIELLASNNPESVAKNYSNHTHSDTKTQPTNKGQERTEVYQKQGKTESSKPARKDDSQRKYKIVKFFPIALFAFAGIAMIVLQLWGRGADAANNTSVPDSTSVSAVGADTAFDQNAAAIQAPTDSAVYRYNLSKQEATSTADTAPAKPWASLVGTSFWDNIDRSFEDADQIHLTLIIYEDGRFVAEFTSTDNPEYNKTVDGKFNSVGKYVIDDRSSITVRSGAVICRYMSELDGWKEERMRLIKVKK